MRRIDIESLRPTREISFRFWNTDTRCMYCDTGLTALGVNGAIEALWDTSYIPMQYIGAMDKMGVKIYELDILRSKLGGIGIVRYHPIWAAFYYAMLSGVDEHKRVVPMRGSTHFYNSASEFTVLGNIYENPDLLEGLLDA